MIKKLKELILGKPLNALNPNIKNHIALVALMAWIGLGADGLSSSAYGPEEAFIALGTHTNIAIYLAFATAITVFLISFAYIQVMELFPNGGGGYKVATHLLGSNAGVVSGAALIIDYILTISVSIASAIDTIFSLLPTWFGIYKIEVEISGIILLMILNLRGIKESIKVLVPLFAGFLITHVLIIVIGIAFHHDYLNQILPAAAHEASAMSTSVGVFVAISMFLRAYSLGGGTYTGLEAISNNISSLAEPKIRTAKITMLLMAVSLSFMAAGIIVLYLLWHAQPVYGQTLNAVVFNMILKENGFNHHFLTLIIFFEAALLLVAANTGFLGCPAVMANMAVDKWLPRQFRELSARLVTQNGVLISGIAAIMILLWSRGRVSVLVVLYSINVFLTFSLSLLGLTVYWLKTRKNISFIKFIKKITISFLGLIVCSAILVITTIEKFRDGGWLTILITVFSIALCFFIRNHYKLIGKQLENADKIFEPSLKRIDKETTQIININDFSLKTAVFFVTKHYGAGLHSILWVQRLFPNIFKNFVFVTSGEIDSESFANEEVFKKKYRQDLNSVIDNYRYFCSANKLASAGYFSYGVDGIKELLDLSKQIQIDYNDCVFFGSKLIFVNDSWWARMLHNNTVHNLQRELHLLGMQMVILPMKVNPL